MAVHYMIKDPTIVTIYQGILNFFSCDGRRRMYCALLQRMLTPEMNSSGMLNYLLKNDLHQVFSNLSVNL